MGNVDLMIAAHALGAVLTTREQVSRHVKRLKAQDWTRS